MTKKKNFLTAKKIIVLSTCFLLNQNSYSLVNTRVQLTKKISRSNHKQQSFYPSSFLTSQFSSWGISPSNVDNSINLLKAWKEFKRKKDVIVAVVDTGIDANHPFLKSNLVKIKNVATHKMNYGMDFSKGAKNKYSPYDSHGHGTHVSGIIKSILPDVRLLELKYYNPQASGQDNLDSTIAALKYAVEQNVDIINYSGGGAEPAIEELRILKQAERKGILVVAAAGNEQSNIDLKKNAYYPASYGLSNIISVTAYNQNMRMLNSSNYGKKSVDIFAPGYRIKSSLPNGRSGYLTGTSQATAFVTGVAAMLKSEFPNLKAKELKKLINQSAKQISSFKNKCLTGGKLNAYAAIKLAKKLYSGIDISRKVATKTNRKKIFLMR